MPNAKDAETEAYNRIMLVGPTGAGKTAQIWTLPGRKFAYIFDPNSMQTLRGLDLDYEPYLPDFLEMDATLKGFNKGSKSDASTTKKEPTIYMRWVEDINDKVTGGFFENYEWLVFDSLTFLSKSVMDRQLYINNRYGDIEELGDYRVVGTKLADVFGSISGLPINILATGHLQTYQDDKTKRIETQLQLPGRARVQLPLMFTNIWKAERGEHKGKEAYVIRTVPESRGLQDIRTSIRGLEPVEDVTIKDWNKAEQYGLGALLKKGH